MEKKGIGKIIRRHSIVIEAIAGILAVVFLTYTMRSLLILGETTLIHDNLLWNYPVFQFFAENIINGHFPLWDPFSHAGESFYPIIGQMRLFEPTALLTIYIGKFFTNDIVMLFNWNRFVQSLVMAFGVYIVFRPLAANLFIKLSLIPILLFSSFMLGSFRQDAILNQFLWVPFIAYFLLRIIYYKDYRWHNWLLLAALIGLNWQSYFFTGTWIFLLFFSSGIVLFYRNLLAELFKARMIILKLSAAAIIIFAMAMPDIILMLEKDKYVFPARMMGDSLKKPTKQADIFGAPLPYEAATSSTTVNGINMPYYFIASTGTFSTVWEFIQIISPDGNNYVGWPSRIGWGHPSEAYMYLGFLPWAIALLGLVAGRHDMKRLWLLILISFGLLMLGPPGGLHRLLYYTYPPVWFLRHTHAFVLFFIFAFLYFYVLGFNHIFRTWQGAVFPPHNAQGLLSRFVKNGKVCRVAAFFMFSACMIVFVYLMTKLTYPVTNYLFGFIILIFAIYWLIRKDLGEKGLWASLIASHIAIVIIFSPNTFKFIRYVIPSLGFPLALFIFIKSREGFSSGLKRYAPIILLSIVSISLISDLVYSLRKSSLLYQGEKHPRITLDINTTSQPPSLPQYRLLEPHNYAAYSEQGMRYLSLAYRQPFVFSPIMEPDYSASYVHAKKVFNGLTNKTFEDWVASQDGTFLPKQLTYHQEGSGGRVERNIDSAGLKEGKVSVLLAPSSKRDSFIQYQTSKMEEIRGQYIRLSLWVKSRNKSEQAIKAEIQVDDGPIASTLYDNSGEWEHFTIGKYIDKDAAKLTIKCSINSSATAPAYLDGFTVDIVDIKPNALEDVLKSKRWNSFLLLKKYFDLIHADIPALALEEMFAVSKPVFQFKQGAMQVEESKTPPFLKQLGPDKSVGLLQKFVIINEPIEPLLGKFKTPPAEYENKDQAVADMQKQENLAYTIERYNYNSFEMKVSANSDGFLYWADGYDKNWHAYINGKEIPIYRANINFKAISLPKGTNNISFVYNPILFKAGLFVFYGIFAACILLSIIFISYYAVRQYDRNITTGQ